MTARGRWRQEDQNLKSIFGCKAMLRPARDSWETRKWNNDSEGSGGVEVWVLLCAGMDQSQWPLLMWIINICQCKNKNKRKAICYWTILRRKLRSQLGCVWAHLEHCDKRPVSLRPEATQNLAQKQTKPDNQSERKMGGHEQINGWYLLINTGKLDKNIKVDKIDKIFQNNHFYHIYKKQQCKHMV